jgi:RHS repeat-associated protein
MLMRVVNPEKGIVNFGYDPLGRRIWKEAKQKRTCWLWDGNVPLHEWTETEREPLIDIVTWVFEDGTFVPTARITDKGCESIVTDYLGTPTQMYDSDGNKTWEADLDIYGRVRTFVGRSLNECCWRYQGQYFDEETNLGYNRFRYIDYDIGSYISQDPIGLAGGIHLYCYVHDVNFLIDPFGLLLNPIYTRGVSGEILTGKVTITQADIGTGTATNANSRARARGFGDATDDAGHVFGRNLGGSGGVEHVFPQNPNLNRGKFNKFEGKVAEMVSVHGKVDATVKLHYKNGSTRPYKISYEVVAPDGSKLKANFKNKH